jgi:hypothetical protein
MNGAGYAGWQKCSCQDIGDEKNLLWLTLLATVASMMVLGVAVSQGIEYLQYLGVGAFILSLVSLSRSLNTGQRNR